MNKNIEDINVSDDHILLSDITVEHDITVKQLVELTGMAASTIYKYMSGACIIPSIIWRVVYKLTKDTRIPKLVTGDMPQIIVPLDATGSDKLEGETIDGLIEMRKKQIEFEELMLGLVSGDDAAKKKYAKEQDKLFTEMTTIQTQVHQAVTGGLLS